MVGRTTSLNDLYPGEMCRVMEITGEGPVRRRLLDMGVVPHQTITVVRDAPLRDPIEIQVGETFMMLRRREAERVVVTRLTKGSAS
ncbi:MAG: ferrous iron transport protein A [Rhodospirillaceae bacterium]|nr:ferrous iron transport protein A [Rhodospirillaceae bacterium]